ncbi:hypothetical protein [Methylobacterium organophilum]|nr:hypothetical protein [Methylobacterium organophilum]
MENGRRIHLPHRDFDRNGACHRIFLAAFASLPADALASGVTGMRAA